MVNSYTSKNPALQSSPAGLDFAGEIIEVGPDATGWHPDERVMVRRIGGYAEYAAVPSTNLIRIPDHMGYAEAASMPNVFITSHDALISNAELARRESVVVTAGGSGIGTASIQLARCFGADRIIATTRNVDKGDRLREIGATDVVDSSTPDYPDTVRAITGGTGADVIIDSVGGPMFADNLDALAIGGRFVSVGRNGGDIGEIDLDLLASKRTRLIGTTFRTRTPAETWRCFEAFVEDCMAGVRAGDLRGIVDKTFPFDALADAHAYLMSDAQVGKVVLVNE